MIHEKINLAVIFGGRSEHIGSVENALGVIDCLKQNPKYNIHPLYITRQGAWLHAENQHTFPLDCNDSNCSLVMNPANKGFIHIASSPQTFIPIDFVFPIVQGDIGEDGCMSGLLELANIPYAGSGVLGSALCMDKIACKMMLSSQGLPNTPFCYTTRSEWNTNPSAIYKMCKKAFPLPWFVKPANMGSSIGISKVSSDDQFQAAMDEAIQYDKRILIEQGIDSPTELEVAIIGNQLPQASRPGEIRCSRSFFSYEAKYIDTDTKILIPAPNLSQEIEEKIRFLALVTYSLLNCSGFARIDFLLSQKNEIFISEINTTPGLRKDRMFPQLLMAEGFSYVEILEKLIELGFEAFEEKQKNKVLGCPTS